jgi:TRAP-type C4-dicarboxylate transport system permease small subunit
METLIVYSLVLLFFILLCVFTVVVLASQPYREPQAVTATQENAAEADSKTAYAVLAAMLLLFFVITLLSERQQAHAQAS